MKAGVAKVGARGPFPTIAPTRLHRGSRARGLLSRGIGDIRRRTRRHEIAGVEQVATDGHIPGVSFPFALRCEAVTCPTRVGIGLEVAHVGDGSATELCKGAWPTQSKQRPRTFGIRPVKRSPPAFTLHR